MFIRTILALIDSITEVGDEAVGVRILDMVTLEDALVLVLTHPVSLATHLALIGDHGAGDGAATELVQIQFVLEQIVICLYLPVSANIVTIVKLWISIGCNRLLL